MSQLHNSNCVSTQCVPDAKKIGTGALSRSIANPRIVTTSWDDGDHVDMKLAEALRSREICGTFYIPIQYRPLPLRPSDIMNLSAEGFEIGAHGCSQKILWGLQSREVDEEVRPCKQILEDIIGAEVEMFCYPRGRYDSRVIRTLQEVGYKGARTVRMLATRPAFAPFEMPTSLQAFPHPHVAYFKNIARSRSVESLRSCVLQIPRLASWVELGKRLFDSVLENGGVWHLYGHSWEIERLGLWNDLRELLDYVSNRPAVQYLPNCGLLRLPLL